MRSKWKRTENKRVTDMSTWADLQGENKLGAWRVWKGGVGGVWDNYVHFPLFITKSQHQPHTNYFSKKKLHPKLVQKVQALVDGATFSLWFCLCIGNSHHNTHTFLKYQYVFLSSPGATIGHSIIPIFPLLSLYNIFFYSGLAFWQNFWFNLIN